MKIKLNKNWKIKTLDSRNLCLYHRVKNDRKDSENYGEYHWQKCGYYGNLEMALRGYVKQASVDLDGAKDIAEILAKLEEIRKEIGKIIKVMEGAK